MRVGDVPVDVHYRDLDVVEHELAEARAGRFRIEPLMFHLAGIPSYLVVAELALGRVLRGELNALEDPEFPDPLRVAAREEWAGRGEWVTNEKRLLDRAGLRGVDDVVTRTTSTDPDTLRTALATVRDLGRAALSDGPR